MPWFLGNSKSIFGWFGWGIAPLLIWSSVWNGLALWHAAKRNNKWWFVILLIVNSVGIVEIYYLLFVVKLFSSTHSPPKHT